MSKKKQYRVPTRQTKLRVRLENAINEAMTYSGMTQRELCQSLDMCNTTLWSRLNDPDSFSLKELRVLATLSGHEYSSFLAEIVR